MLYLLIFLLGASVGSFLNVLIYRLPKREKIIFSRSACPACSHKLYFFDLIPIFSFLFLGGCCRYCRTKISWQYPLVELAAGLLFLFAFLSHYSTFYISAQGGPASGWLNPTFYILLLRDWLFIAVMVFVFTYDLRYMLIEDVVVIPATIVIFLLNLLAQERFTSIFLGGIIGLVFFLFQYILTKKRGLGEGDLRLGVLMGVMFAWPKVLIAIFTSYLIGGIISLFLLIILKKKLSSQIPLGPFLAIGSLITLFFSEEIINFYF